MEQESERPSSSQAQADRDHPADSVPSANNQTHAPPSAEADGTNHVTILKDAHSPANGQESNTRPCTASVVAGVSVSTPVTETNTATRGDPHAGSDSDSELLNTRVPPSWRARDQSAEGEVATSLEPATRLDLQLEEHTQPEGNGRLAPAAEPSATLDSAVSQGAGRHSGCTPGRDSSIFPGTLYQVAVAGGDAGTGAGLVATRDFYGGSGADIPKQKESDPQLCLSTSPRVASLDLTVPFHHSENAECIQQDIVLQENV